MFKSVFCVLLAQSCLLFSAPFFVGIAGGTGSGKTTLAKKICSQFPNAVLISQDSYYRPLSHLSFEERKSVNFDHPDSIEFSLLQKQLIDLKNGHSIKVPCYDFCEHMRTAQSQLIESTNIIVVEGILLFTQPELRDLFDLKIFVDTDSDERVLRRAERDIKERARTLEDVTEQYIKTVKPMHDTFVEPSKKFADIIIPEGGLNPIAVDLVLAKLSQYE